MNEPVKLVTTLSDQDRATEIKRELVEAIEPCLKVLSKAYSEGFHIQYHCSPNAFKQFVIQQLIISKIFD